MDARKRNALAYWWFRRSIQSLLAVFTCSLLALSLARVLGLDPIDWPAVARWIFVTYDDLLLWLGRSLVQLLSSHGWIFDVIAIYLLAGGLMRLSIRDIALHSEKQIYQKKQIDWDDDYHKGAVATARSAGNVESSKFYLLWPVRLYSDIKNRIYWHLTPKRMLIYFVCIVIPLTVLTVL